MPQGTWVNNNSNLAVTETADRLALAREAAAKSIVLLKNATKVRKDGSTGTLLPIQVPATGTFKVLVTGFYGNNTNFYLGGYSSIAGQRTGRPRMCRPTTGSGPRSRRSTRRAAVDFMRGFTGTGTNAGNCCSTVDPAAVTAAASYDYVIVYAGMDSATRRGRPATEDRDRTSLLLPGQQGPLINQVAAANPNTVAFMETIGPQDVTPFEPNVGCDPVELVHRPAQGRGRRRRAARRLQPERPHERDLVPERRADPGDHELHDPAGRHDRPHLHVLQRRRSPTRSATASATRRSRISNLQLDSHALDANDTLQRQRRRHQHERDGRQRDRRAVRQHARRRPALERPIKRLEGFQKVSLDPGQTKTVTLRAR